MEVEDYSYNSTIREYLENHMGPQHISLAVVVPITVVYVLVFVSGIIGNVAVCLVISRNSHFQTATNYYLFSLAISDLLILLFGLPNDLKVYWQQYPWVFGETVCKLRALIAEMTSYASVLTIVAFSLERYIAICHPLFIQKVSTLARAIKIITIVWILACISAIPFAVFTKINYLEYPIGSGNNLQESAFCALPMENFEVNRPLLQCSSFAFFCLPMTLIVILYAKLGFRLHRPRLSRMSSDVSSGYSPSSGNGRQTVVRRSVHKMLVAVVIAFFVCWAPFHAQRLLAVCVPPDKWTLKLRTLNEVLYYSAGCLYYFSATINPILYSLMSTKYRDAFRDTLCYFRIQKREKDQQVFRYTNRNGDILITQEKNTSWKKEKEVPVLKDPHSVHKSHIITGTMDKSSGDTHSISGKNENNLAGLLKEAKPNVDDHRTPFTYNTFKQNGLLFNRNELFNQELNKVSNSISDVLDSVKSVDPVIDYSHSSSACSVQNRCPSESNQYNCRETCV